MRVSHNRMLTFLLFYYLHQWITDVKLRLFSCPGVLCEHMICASEWDTYSSSLRIFHISLNIFLPLGICWLSTLTSVRILMTLQSSNWRLSHYEAHETLMMRIEYLVLLYEYHINKYVKRVAFLVFSPPDTDFKAKL